MSGRRLSLAAAVAAVFVVSLAAQPSPELVVQGASDTPFALRSVWGGNDRWLVIVDGTALRIIDAATGLLIRLVEAPPEGGGATIVGFAPHPFRNQLALVASDGSITMMDIRSGALEWRTPPAERGEFTVGMSAAVRFNRNATALTSILTSANLSGLINPTFGSVMRTLFTHEPFRSRAFTSRWRVSDGAPIESAIAPRNTSMEELRLNGMSGDGEWFYVFDKGRGNRWSTEIRRVDSGALVRRQIPGLVVAAHSRSPSAVVASIPGMLGNALIDLASGKDLTRVGGLFSEFSSDGTRLLLPGIRAGSWRVVDTSSGNTLFDGGDASPLAYDWSLSRDGRQVAATQGQQLIVARLDAPITYALKGASEEPVFTIGMADRLTGPDAAPELVAAARRLTERGNVEIAASFTPDGRWLAVRAGDGLIDLWDTATGNRAAFRLPAPNRSSGPIEARTARTMEDGARPAAPIVVRAYGDNRRGAASGYPQVTTTPENVAPSSAWLPLCTDDRDRFEIAIGRVAGDALGAVLRERETKTVIADLVAIGIDLQSGCSIGPNAETIAVRGVLPPGTVPDAKASGPATLGCAFLGRCGGVVLDPTSQLGDVARQMLLTKSTSVLLYDIKNRRPRGMLADAGGTKSSTLTMRLVWSDGGGYVAQAAASNGRVRAWSVQTGSEVDLAGAGLKASYLVGFVPGSEYLLTRGRADGSAIAFDTMDVWDLSRPARVQSLLESRVPIVPPASGTRAATPNLAFNGAAFLEPARDGSLAIRSWSTGHITGHLRPMAGGEWLVTTPDGLFDGSPGGWRRLTWRTADGFQIAPGEIFFSEFYEPGLLAALLAGRAPRNVRPISERDRRQPAVRLEAAARDGQASLSLRVQEVGASDGRVGSGVRDVRLFRNGILIKSWRGPIVLDGSGAASFDVRVPLASGRNRFSAYAFNADNIKSEDAAAEIDGPAPTGSGTLYIVAIGVNAYANDAFNLTFAVPDAETFASALATQQAARGVTRIVTVKLLDRDASRDNIVFVLNRLSGRALGPAPSGAPESIINLPAARPDDAVVFYFAGHGVAHEERFHMIPADMRYIGSRDQASAGIDQILANGISDRDLELLLEPLDVTHLLVVIDACQSGQALESDETRFGPMNSRGLAQLAYEKGMAVLAASQSYQAALESARLGHGYLTYALVEEALRTPVADTAPKDGLITATEWFEFAAGRVPELQAAALDAARAAGRTLRFDAGVDANRERLQLPRVFLRRDATLPPFIVAAP